MRSPHLSLILPLLFLLAAPASAQQAADPPGSEECSACHEPGPLTKREEGIPPNFDAAALQASPHAGVECGNCHMDLLGAEFPHPEKLEPVDCGMCHSEEAEQYDQSLHGRAAAKGDRLAPRCTTCHGTHNIQRASAPGSPTSVMEIPRLCGQCHREGTPVSETRRIPERNILTNYEDSIHGVGLFRKGLTVTAVCTSCHTAHHELPASNPASSVNRRNITTTCGRCHRGIVEQFDKSIHSPKVAKTGKELPVCTDCHSAHRIERVDRRDFRFHIMDQCGRCHKQITESYFETFHGKFSRLGYDRAAKCYDCHGAHDILPPSDPNSHLSRKNIVATCAQCHPRSNRRFAGYLTHATHDNPAKYPFLFFTFWAMTALLIGTLVISGAHTLLWLRRSLQYRREMKAPVEETGAPYVRRFRPFERNLHLMVISSFLGLAITGMMLKFSYTGWAQALASVVGGFGATGWIHRLCAVITFTYFGLHLWDLLRQRRASGKGWMAFIFGPESMVFNGRDLKELIGSMKWFFNKGPRPQYGRWTYWEKFDYFAVFWGVGVIGISGLMLWFPEQFTRILPGWSINVATIVHSDEALLATGFIFTIHFFNTHFRPEKFPMDTVVFTRGVPLEEFKHDRPREYRQLVESGKLDQYLMPPPSENSFRWWRRFGFTALATGLVIVVLIIVSMLFVYR